MLNLIRSSIIGVFTFVGFCVNTILGVCIVMVFVILKLVIPIPSWRKFCSNVLIFIANSWIFVNTTIISFTRKIEWDVHGLEDLKMDDWYLVISNHQSWVDIFVLQKVLYRKVPFLKFFLKKELMWIPLLGIAWWALDFPFMKRYSEAFLKKNPHLKGKDIEITKKACEKFKTTPVSVMNFCEGTRFAKEKHDRQQSPFTYLLKPKAGGIAFVLTIMGRRISNIVNVTICYPNGVRSMWHFLSGNVNKITVDVDVIPVKEEILGDYINDTEYRKSFQGWLNNLWVGKDKKLKDLYALSKKIS
ncbi:acyltransferase [Spirochaetota bacterium]